MADHYLAEVTVADPTTGVETILYFSNGTGFMTAPGDSPSSQFYEPLINQPVNISRALFTGPATQGASRVGYGELVLINTDSALNYLLDYGIGGRDVRILRSEIEDPTYVDFNVVLAGTMDIPDFAYPYLRLKLRDNQFQLQVALQPTKYTGAGLGTLEGVADSLKGKPKPVCYGAASNFSPPFVETGKLIAQVSEGLVASIDAVYDKGLPLSFAFPPTDTGGGTSALGMATDGTILIAVAGNVIRKWDGTSWTTLTHPSVPGGLQDVAYFAALHMWVAVGLPSGIGQPGAILTSVDSGATWVVRSVGNDVYWQNVAVGPTSIVIVGNDIFANVVRIRSSTDGVTFSNRTVPFTNPYGVGVGIADYGNGKFVVGGGAASDTTMELATSSDAGVTWSLVTVVGLSSYPAGATVTITRFLNNLWLIGTIAGDVLTSTDGVEFGSHKSGLVYANGFAFLLGQYYAGSGATGAMSNSVDGSNWIPIESTPFSGITTTMIVFGGHIYLGDGAGHVLKTQGPKTYATAVDLLDDTKAPPAGTYGVFLDATGSYFRLGAQPQGSITCDVTQGANLAARTAAQIYKQLLARQGFVPDAGDIAALDALNAAVIGFWTDQEIQLTDVCDQVAGSVGAWWGVDYTGTFRIKQFTLPTDSPVRSFVRDDLMKPPARLASTDPGRGAPVFRQIVNWGINYTVQATGLADAVSSARRAYLADVFRSAKVEDLSVQAIHLLAQEMQEDSLLTVEADALAEATRRLPLRKVRRDRLAITAELTDENDVVDLGDTVELVNAAIGSDPVGVDPEIDQIVRRYVVLGIETDALNKRLSMNIWGPNTEQKNLAADDGALFVTDDGLYLITSPE